MSNAAISISYINIMVIIIDEAALKKKNYNIKWR